MVAITKNANLILLFLIVLSSTALVGATVFFQLNFEKINDEYNMKLLQLQSVSKELQIQQTVLEKIKGELSLRTERESELGSKFTEVKGEREALATEKAKLELTSEQLESELENTNTMLRDSELELQAKKDVVKTLTGENDLLTVHLDVCEDRRDNFEDERDDCQTEKALCTCP